MLHTLIDLGVKVYQMSPEDLNKRFDEIKKEVETLEQVGGSTMNLQIEAMIIIARLRDEGILDSNITFDGIKNPDY